MRWLTKLAATAVDASRRSKESAIAKYELTMLVLDPVAGEMHEQHVVALAIGEELLHCQGDFMVGLIDQRAYLEATDLRIAQNSLKRPGITGRGLQLP